MEMFNRTKKKPFTPIISDNIYERQVPINIAREIKMFLYVEEGEKFTHCVPIHGRNTFFFFNIKSNS
jgi:hypothetical protein